MINPLQINIKGINHVDFAITFVLMKKECKQDVVFYRGEDAKEKFVEMLENDLKKIHKKIRLCQKKKKMIYTDKDRGDFNKATHCWICKEPLEK